jgi:phenylacetate-CoA ligase
MRIHDWKMELYWRLPILLQEFALSAYSIYLDRCYYGPTYRDWCAEMAKRQRWSAAEALDWQNKRLGFIVRLAATRVPHYKDEWRHLDWRSVRTVADLPILPLLDKHAIRQNELRFIAERLDPSSLWVEKTSGTTGTSLRIYWPFPMLPQFWAMVELMVRKAVGVAQEIPRAMMGGRPIVRGGTRMPPFWRYNRHWKQLYLSSYHVSPRTAPLYIAALRRHGSQWMTGYGSAMAALAESALAAGIQPVSLRAVIPSGDTLTAGMRQSIEKFFQCKCFDHYGQSEGVAMAMECRYGKMHVLPMLGIIEILRSDGSPCRPGEVGEIVATGLMNEAMPLIRYRLGDYAAWDDGDACPCGNPQPAISRLEGRVDDYLLTSDGRRIGRLSTALKRSPSVHSAQIIQHRPGCARLLVRPSNGYCQADALAIRDDILEKIGAFDIEVYEVPEIPKNPQGKSSLVVRLEDRPAMRTVYEKLLRSSGVRIDERWQGRKSQPPRSGVRKSKRDAYAASAPE